MTSHPTEGDSPAAHTPRPWKASCTEDGSWSISAGGYLVPLNQYEGDNDEENEANARLIAAAPDMLKALKSAAYSVNVARACLMDSVETHGSHGGWLHTEALRLDSELDLIRAAIHLATKGDTQ